MRWLIIAAILSLLIHGILFSIHFHGMPHPNLTPPRTRTVTVALSYRTPSVMPAIHEVPQLYKPPASQKPLQPRTPRTPLRSKAKKQAALEPILPAPVMTQMESPSPPTDRQPQDALPGHTAGKDISNTQMLHEATPLYQDNPPPRYPRIARKRGYEGIVVLEVLVSPQGTVTDLKIDQSSGYPLLDDAAKESVWRWTFSPGMRGDQPVAMWVKLPVRFQLK